eukprot:2895251-Rhodomonas_salina.1
MSDPRTLQTTTRMHAANSAISNTKNRTLDTNRARNQTETSALLIQTALQMSVFAFDFSLAYLFDFGVHGLDGGRTGT